ncbi:hypothetical protein [Halogeometricum borinquense]|uniref:hypothetical protein n=1 Tax=Halogeometricum borinquense TaxID=60847 RepID=UPI0034152A48
MSFVSLQLTPLDSLISFGLYILFIAVVSMVLIFAITGGIGLLGAVLSVPFLYVFPDVRRYLILASGGQPEAEISPWRMAFRPRYLLLAILFGVGYGITFLFLFEPIRTSDFMRPIIGPVPLIAGIPAAFVLLATPVVYTIHRRSSAWTPETSKWSVLLQWAVFLTAVVTLGTAIPALAVRFQSALPLFSAL